MVNRYADGKHQILLVHKVYRSLYTLTRSPVRSHNSIDQYKYTHFVVVLLLIFYVIVKNEMAIQKSLQLTNILYFISEKKAKTSQRQSVSQATNRRLIFCVHIPLIYEILSYKNVAKVFFVDTWMNVFSFILFFNFLRALLRLDISILVWG